MPVTTAEIPLEFSTPPEQLRAVAVAMRGALIGNQQITTAVAKLANAQEACVNDVAGLRFRIQELERWRADLERPAAPVQSQPSKRQRGVE